MQVSLLLNASSDVLTSRATGTLMKSEMMPEVIGRVARRQNRGHENLHFKKNAQS